MRTLLLIAALLSVLGCEPAPAPRPDVTERPAVLTQPTPIEPSAWLRFTGEAQAPRTVDLGFEIDGRITRLAVMESQQVKAGELLAELDLEQWILAESRAQAELRLATQELQRVSALRQRELISQAELDLRETEVEVLGLKLKQARETLADATLNAPGDITVLRRYVDAHAHVQSGDPVLRIMFDNELDVVAAVPESLVATVTEQQVRSMHARFDAAPDRAWPVEVREYAAEADPQTRTFAVRFALLERPEWNVRPGMTAAIELEIATGQVSPLTLPISALQTAADGRFFVWAIEDAEGAVQRRNVTVGQPVGDRIEIRSGVDNDTTVVAVGGFALQPGMRVRPLEGAAP